MEPPTSIAKIKVFKTTLAAALVPGLGHLLLGQARSAALLFTVTAAGILTAAWHMTAGLALFETSLGVFLFSVMLRGIAIIQAFAVLDVYLWSVDPAGRIAPPLRRRAVVLNMLVPGTGYLLARAWVRAATGLLLLVLVVYFAKAGHPYLDLIYMLMQAIMGVAVYHQLRAMEAGKGDRPAPLRDPLPEVQEAQIVVLVMAVAALVWAGYVMQRRLPHSGLSGLTLSDIQVKPGPNSVRFAIPRLGLSMTAAGPGWQPSAPGKGGYLFQAAQQGDADMKVGVQQIPAFLPRDRFLRRVRRWVEDKGFIYKKSTELTLNGAPAVKMQFSGDFSYGRVDHWTVAVPRDHIAFIVMLSCLQQTCSQMEPRLQQTLQSFKVR